MFAYGKTRELNSGSNTYVHTLKDKSEVCGNFIYQMSRFYGPFHQQCLDIKSKSKANNQTF
jgi:hypothetical protein